MIEINNSQNITMRDIQNYEGLYKITQDGRVWNCNLFRFLSPRQSVNGYLRIGLTKNGVKTTYSIHRLVAETFIPNPNHLPQVNHIDENKLNNNINNLEWCDYLYNNTYGTRIERVVKTNKNRTPVKCIETNEIYASQGQAARSIGRYNAPIGYACKTGGTAYGYHWRFMSKEEYENETNNLS